MELRPNGKPSLRSEVLAALLSAIAGSGIGWLIWLASNNIGAAIGMAGPIAALANNVFRRVIK